MSHTDVTQMCLGHAWEPPYYYLCVASFFRTPGKLNVFVQAPAPSCAFPTAKVYIIALPHAVTFSSLCSNLHYELNFDLQIHRLILSTTWYDCIGDGALQGVISKTEIIRRALIQEGGIFKASGE